MVERNNTIEYLRVAYITHKWIRLMLCVGIVIAGFLLNWLCGGFPPWTWRFLVQVVPQLPALWEWRGFGLLLPLVGLILLSITLLIVWGGLAMAIIRIAHHWWQERRELKSFDRDVREAQDQARSMQQQQETLHTSPMLPWPARGGDGEWAGASPASPWLARAGAGDRAGASPAPTMATHLPANPFMPGAGLAPALSLAPSLEKQRKLAPVIPVAHGTSLIPAGHAAINDFDCQASSHLLVSTGLDTGITRKGKPNEDSLFAFENTRTCKMGTIPVGLFIVADGMGGHENGQEASQLATRILRETLLPALQHGPEDEIFSELLVEVIHRANLALYQRNRQQQGDMGTTLTVAIIFGDTAYVANVGDSRTYLYRDAQGLSQITRDHSTVAQLVQAGAITPEEVYTHPKRNVIYRSLGSHASEEIDSFTVPLQIGDILLLCSDGLWEMVRDPEIEMIIRASRPYPSQISTMLIQAALNRGGKDNISTVIVCVKQGSAPYSATGTSQAHTSGHVASPIAGDPRAGDPRGVSLP